MDILLCLAEQQGRVLERSFIKREVWGDEEISDDQLARYISLLRNLLGDSSHHPKFIRTITRRGYQLLMPVHAAGAPDAPQPDDDSGEDERPWIARLASDLQRRRVIRVVGAYAIAVWVGLSTGGCPRGSGHEL